jgi:hypothetical protein
MLVQVNESQVKEDVLQERKRRGDAESQWVGGYTALTYIVGGKS